MDSFLQQMASRDWYTQGFAARPIFLMKAGNIDSMHKDVGFSYNAICASFKNDYCEFRYWNEDIVANAKIISEKLEKDPHYLEKARKQNQKSVEKLENVYTWAHSDLNGFTNAQLLDMAKKGASAIEESVGGAHMLESVSFMLEHKLRERLEQQETGKQLNEDFTILTSPTTISFLSERDRLLWKIKNEKSGKKDLLISQFIKAFYWTNTSYVGNVAWTKKTVLEAAEEMTQAPKLDFTNLKQEKETLFKKYKFPEKEKERVRWIEFSTSWQDDRKKNIFRGICALEKVLNEMAQRAETNVKYLEYVLPSEMTLQTFENGEVAKLGKERSENCVFVSTLGKFHIYSGKEAEDFERMAGKKHESMQILTGNAACLGMATGPVKVCTTIESLEKVRQGDILVASMTRPEYIGAMKKAAAIVTDEGGITCHAAIVSRELGIPCIIGTKIATKVLMDGWIVQVKANHGQVVVLEKKVLAVSHPQKQK